MNAQFRALVITPLRIGLTGLTIEIFLLVWFAIPHWLSLRNVDYGCVEWRQLPFGVYWLAGVGLVLIIFASAWMVARRLD